VLTGRVVWAFEILLYKGVTLIKDLWEKYAGLVLPLKLLIGTVLGIALGPGFVGFLSEYATYFYAIELGIRPPLEGIPYLKSAVTAGSLILTIVVATIFLISRVVASAIAEQLASYLSKVSSFINIIIKCARKLTFGRIEIPDYNGNDAIVKLKSLPPKLAILLSIFVAAGFFIGFYVFLRVKGDPNAVYAGVAVGIYVLVATITTWSKKAVKWVSFSSAIAFYLFSFILLFNASYYSSFLRGIGYGGGSKVTIFLKEDDSIYNECFMILRTTKSVICMDNKSSTINEIPISKIHKISYEVSGLGGEFKLPASIPNKAFKPDAEKDGTA